MLKKFHVFKVSAGAKRTVEKLQRLGYVELSGATVAEISKALKIGAATTRKHLKELMDVGLIGGEIAETDFVSPSSRVRKREWVFDASEINDWILAKSSDGWLVVEPLI